MPRPKTPSTQQGRNASTADAVDAACRELRALLQDDFYMSETPIEVQLTMQQALSALEDALATLRRAPAPTPDLVAESADRPTPKQGQFLAYIHAYMSSHHAGLAPTHADLQRFFKLTPPSVNSMLVRLEQRGFIHRIPGQARGIALTIHPALLPPLERPLE